MTFETKLVKKPSILGYSFQNCAHGKKTGEKPKKKRLSLAGLKKRRTFATAMRDKAITSYILKHIRKDI